MTMPLRRHLAFWLAGFALFFLAIYLFSGILLPFVAGMATAYLLDPVCDRLERAGLSRTWATVVVTLVFLVVLVLGFVILVPAVLGQLGAFIERAPDYVAGLRDLIEQLIATVQERVDPELLERARDAAAGSIDNFIAWISKTIGGLVSGGVAFANFLSLLIITPIVAFYLLRDWDRIVEQIDSWLPREQAEVIREQLRKIDSTLAGFVRGQASVCVILGLFYALALTLAGLDFGLAIGLIAGLVSFIPFVGSLTGGILSIGLALVQFDDWLRVAIVAGIFVLGQAAEGNFLTPKLVGDRVGLHPVWVIFALLAGGALFGFVGMLIALPVAATIGVLSRFALEQYLDSPFYRGGGDDEEEATPVPGSPGRRIGEP